MNEPKFSAVKSSPVLCSHSVLLFLCFSGTSSKRVWRGLIRTGTEASPSWITTICSWLVSWWFCSPSCCIFSGWGAFTTEPLSSVGPLSSGWRRVWAPQTYLSLCKDLGYLEEGLGFPDFPHHPIRTWALSTCWICPISWSRRVQPPDFFVYSIGPVNQCTYPLTWGGLGLSKSSKPWTLYDCQTQINHSLSPFLPSQSGAFIWNHFLL